MVGNMTRRDAAAADAGRFLCRPIVFMQPERTVHPPSWLEHTPFAFWIVDALRPSVFVELGCQTGNSYSSFAQAVRTLGLSTACYAVDTWRGDEHSGFFDEQVFEEWSAYHDQRFAAFSQLVRATFDDTVGHFADGSIDLLHIDGYHTFDAVSHDFETWQPKMSSRAVVLCHDINVRERDFGAWRLWERLRAEYPSFEFLQGHGLGVLGVGHDPPEPLKWLFSLRANSSETTDLVRLFFSHLGGAVLNRYNGAGSVAALSAEHAAREQADADVLRLESAVIELTGQLTTAEVARASDAAESERRLAAAQQELTRVSEAHRTAEEALRDRVIEVQRLASRVDHRTAQVVRLEGKLKASARALRAREAPPAEIAAPVELSVRSLTPREDGPPTILVVSHVGPSRPRAGNEYRVRRMLCWYRQQGYRIIPVIAPLAGEELPPESIAEIAAEFGNAVQCHRDGRIEYSLENFGDAAASLNHLATPSFATVLNEDVPMSERQRQLLRLDRMFCHDALIATVLHLQRALARHVLQVEYIWMTRLLPLVRGDVLKIIDTHDVFSSIGEKVAPFGLREITIDAREEAKRLRRGDLAIAIQDDERAELERIAPSVLAITAGVDFDVVDRSRPARGRRILYVASDNARNRKGLDDFLSLAWPRVHRAVPEAELLVVGSVAKTIANREMPGVLPIGAADDLDSLYDEAAVVINPAVAGTGLKIKILEALCHFRPVVTFPAGVDGIEPPVAAHCLVARDWYEFAEHLIDVVSKPGVERFPADARRTIAERVAPEHVYAALDAELRRFFQRDQPSSEPIGLKPEVAAARI